jgi:hypothetical protein
MGDTPTSAIPVIQNPINQSAAMTVEHFYITAVTVWFTYA